MKHLLLAFAIGFIAVGCRKDEPNCGCDSTEKEYRTYTYTGAGEREELFYDTQKKMYALGINYGNIVVTIYLCNADVLPDYVKDIKNTNGRFYVSSHSGYQAKSCDSSTYIDHIIYYYTIESIEIEGKVTEQ